MFKKLTTCVIAIACFLPQLVWAGTRDVCPSCAFTNIGAAILASQNGDTIRIASGIYGGFENDPTLRQGYPSVKLIGGFNNTFSERNGETVISGIGVQLTPQFVGELSVDSVTFSDGSSIYVGSTAASLSVSNCKFNNPNGAAIVILPYYPLPEYPWSDRRQRASTYFTFINNQIFANPTYGALDIYTYTDGAWISTTLIEGNTIRGATQQYASGINYYSNGPTDSVVVRNNHLYENTTGLKLHLQGPNAFAEVSENNIHDNLESGMRLTQGPNLDGHYLINNNRIYSHSLYGLIFRNPGRARVSQNVFHANQWVGLKFYGDIGSPYIINNIFSHHPQRSLEISANETGWGTARILPSALKHNNFFNSSPAAWFFHESLTPAYSYHSELSGDWNDINQFVWSDGNFSEDPRYRNPASGDFSLASDSFCIDEGESSAPFSNEPTPHGDRANLGVNGNTPQAEPTPAMPGIGQLMGEQAGDEINISLNLSSEVNVVWIFAEYQSESGWIPISPSELSGGDYKVGYKGGRIKTGFGRSLTWTGAITALAGKVRSDFMIRATVYHGNRMQRAESPPFAIDFGDPAVEIASPPANAYLPIAGSPFTAVIKSFRSAPSAVRFEYKKVGSPSFVTLSSDTAAPYEANWAGHQLEVGAKYIFRATALDASANAIASPEVAISVCGESLGTSSSTHSSAGGEGELTLSTGGSCAWTASTSASWVSISSGSSGVGSGAIRFRLESNSGSARSATITIGSATYSIFQSAVSCTAALSSSVLLFPAVGGGGIFGVDVNLESCDSSLTGLPEWLVLEGNSSGTGDRQLRYQIAPNTSLAERSARISVGGSSVELAQSPTICEVNFSVSAASFEASGGAGSLTVGTNIEGCSWSITGVPSWIILNDAATGFGNRTIAFNVAENTTSDARQTALLLGGEAIQLQQSGAARWVTITLLKSGTGKGSIANGNGTLLCGEECSTTSFRVPFGERVSLTTTLPTDSKISGWAGADCSSAENVCSFVGTDDITLTLSLEALPPYLNASVSKLVFTKKKRTHKITLRSRDNRPIKILGVGLSSRKGFSFSGLKAGNIIGGKQKLKTFSVSLKSLTSRETGVKLIIISTDPHRPVLEITLDRAFP